MSVINKMLRDLDRRKATSEGEPTGSRLRPESAPEGGGARSKVLVGVAGVVVLGGAAWYLVPMILGGSSAALTPAARTSPTPNVAAVLPAPTAAQASGAVQTPPVTPVTQASPPPAQLASAEPVIQRPTPPEPPPAREAATPAAQEKPIDMQEAISKALPVLQQALAARQGVGAPGGGAGTSGAPADLGSLVKQAMTVAANAKANPGANGQQMTRLANGEVSAGVPGSAAALADRVFGQAGAPAAASSERPRPERPRLSPATRLALENAFEKEDLPASNTPAKTATVASAATTTAAIRRSPANGATTEESDIQKRMNLTPRRQADAELAKAVAVLQQGRVHEALGSLSKALAADPSHDVARQLAVALLVEQGRLPEAQALLAEGLEANPGNATFATMQARLAMETGNAEAALAVLVKYAQAGIANDEYRGFTAALFQRTGRHAQAIAEYMAAVQIAPHVGRYWLGLGISQQATGENQVALESFRRARSTGTLSGELVAVAEQRIRQLQ